MKLAIAMVGLPARGKTYVARRIARYLAWLGHRTAVFNVGNYRRERLGPGQPAAFFDPANVEGAAAREAMAMQALDDTVAWLAQGPGVAIYDATNSTRARRAQVSRRLKDAGIELLFVESLCNDPAIIERNVRQTKVSSPDYAGVDAEQAVRDFLARIAFYARSYEPMTDDEGSFVRLVDVGRQVIANRVDGYVPAKLVSFLLNLHISPRPIWFSRHGESLYNRENRVGGDPALSPRGLDYANRLAPFMQSWARGEGEIVVWTSTLQRTRQTASLLGVPSKAWKALDEIDVGICDSLTYSEVEVTYPDESAARRVDKLRYRYPRGESYEDVIARLEPVLVELERERRPTLVIAHQAVIRALLAYFTDRPRDEVPHLPVPLHTVIELVPHAYGCTERRIELGPGTEP